MIRKAKPGGYYWCADKPSKKNSTAKDPGLAVATGGPFASVQDCLNDAVDNEDNEEDRFSGIWIGTEVTTGLTPSECSSSRAASEVFDGIATALWSCTVRRGGLLVAEEQRKKALADLSSFLAQWAPTFLISTQPRMILAAATKYQLPRRYEKEVALKTWLDSCPVPLDQKFSAGLQKKLKG